MRPDPDPATTSFRNLNILLYASGARSPPNSRAAHRPPRLAPRGGGWPARRRGEVDPGRSRSSAEGEVGGRGCHGEEGARWKKLDNPQLRGVKYITPSTLKSDILFSTFQNWSNYICSGFEWWVATVMQFCHFIFLFISVEFLQKL